jgi:hypothetical protein
MFNSFDVLNRETTVSIAQPSTKVGDTNKYEGKDNPGSLWYHKQQERKKGEKEKKNRPKGDHKVDFVA